MNTYRQTNVTHHTADRRQSLALSSTVNCSECAKYFWNLLHTQNPISVSNPPPHRTHTHTHWKTSRSRISLYFASWSKQLALLIWSICAIKMKWWLESQRRCLGSNKTLKFTQIQSQRFLSCYSKNMHYWRPSWVGRIPGWSRVDSGSGPSHSPRTWALDWLETIIALRCESVSEVCVCPCVWWSGEQFKGGFLLLAWWPLG